MITRLSETWKQQKEKKRTGEAQNGDVIASKESWENLKSVEFEQKSSDKDLIGKYLVDSTTNDSLLPHVNLKTINKLHSHSADKSFTQVVSKVSSTPKIPKTLKSLKSVTSSICEKMSPIVSITKANTLSHVKTNSTNDSLNGILYLRHWNLPDTILNAYQKKGITKMFQWQHECLLTGSALEGGNLVYSAPTSAGKTLVAEILMLKRVLETKRKAIYILPFVSVAREKMYNLRDQFEEGGVNVGGFMGSETPPGGFSSIDIAVCTIEKANSLVNRLLEENKLSLLCSIVVDEMHMLGDPGRGYLLELLLTKVRFMTSRNRLTIGDDKSNNLIDSTIQIIGLSATLPNIKMLANWLKADLYFTDYRPVPLTEMIKSGKSLFSADNKKVCDVQDLGDIKGDEDGVLPLCVDTIVAGNSVLIFCPTKVWCEKLAATISQYFFSKPEVLKIPSHCFQKAPELTTLEDSKNAIDDVIDQLRRSPSGLDDTLHSVVQNSVAFHHAGLTFDERDIIEGAFRRGVLRVLVATSTLSSGVNLPARRVIVRSPMFHGKLLDSLVYKQMVGRAGRKGVDTHGESVLVCKPSEKSKSLALLTSHLKPVYSCLLDSSDCANLKSMKRALLEVIAAGVLVTPKDVEQYFKYTYLHTCLSELENCNAEEAIMSTMKFLLDNEFIRVQNLKSSSESLEFVGEKYFSTQLGSATLASSLSPDEALLVFEELQKARKCFVLENELHIIYQITPIYLQDQWPELDWFNYFHIWERLPTHYKNVGELVGVKESVLAKAVRSRLPTRTTEQVRSIRIHRRFYAALVLQDLVNEVSLATVSKRYKINRGLLQSLQNTAATFAGMVTVFCQKLGWNCLELLLEQFQSRLSFGVSRELCNLVRISLLNGFKARVLYNGGYQSVSAVAYSNKDDLARLLRDSAPFESKQNKTKSRHANSRFIWLTGKEGLTEHEAAELIVAEARRILKADANALGIPAFDLDQSVNIFPKEICNSSSFKKKGTSTRTVNKPKSIGRKRSSTLTVVDISCKKRSPDKADSPPIIFIGESEVVKIGPAFTLDETSQQVKQTLRPDVKEAYVQSSDTTSTVIQNSASPEDKGNKKGSDVELFSDEDKSLELFNGSDYLINNSNEYTSKTSDTQQDDVFVGIENRLDHVTENISALLSHEKEPCDSILLLHGSRLQERNATPSPLDFSLRLSSSEDMLETQEIVLPLKLEDQFNNACSQRSQLNEKETCNNDDFLGISITDSLVFTSQATTRNEFINQHNQTSKSISSINSDEFLIIDVTSQKELFLTFLQEWRSQQTFSFSLACEKVKSVSPNVIGNRLKPKSEKHQRTTNKRSVYSDKYLCVVGLAVCWGHKDAYYINLELCSPEEDTVMLNDTLQTPRIAASLSADFRLNAIKSTLTKATTGKSMICFQIKDQLKILYKMMNVSLAQYLIRDPKVADWMLDPDDKPRTLHAMSKKYLTKDLLAIANGGELGTRTLGMLPQSPGMGRIHACVEAVLCYNLMNVLENRLKDEELIKPFLEIEMPCITSLAVLELNGIGFSDLECNKLKRVMKEKLASIEQECYQLANQTFSLTSPDEVARVLFHDLGLPPNGAVEGRLVPAQRERAKEKSKTTHLSTSKLLLEKLTKYHRLPKLILEWRRVNNALTKVVYPLQRKRVVIESLDMARIYSEAQFHTSTGRVTFSEPNLQNVPKEFDMKLPAAIEDSQPDNTILRKGRKKKKNSLLSKSSPQSTRLFNPGLVSPGELFCVSMRSTFIPHEAAVFLAADYCQLELRLIAHLASDEKLVSVLNASVDVFKSIAAEINEVSVGEVTQDQRQRAKQICYGIIYGMGGKALGDQLHVCEEEASVYMQQFKDRYSSVKQYTKKLIKSARELGYVKTIAGRKRYLKSINSTNNHARAQAERQAVNTTVQGSAADLVKKAMCSIDCELRKRFKSCCLQRDKHSDSAGQRGGFLVLQLHDELIYEVNKKDIECVQSIVKYEMENAFKLDVKMPVKIKIGNNWGNLRDFS